MTITTDDAELTRLRSEYLSALRAWDRVRPPLDDVDDVPLSEEQCTALRTAMAAEGAYRTYKAYRDTSDPDDG